MGLFKKKIKTRTFSAIHLCGLDIPEYCKSEVITNSDEMIIRSCGKEYVLKIQNIKCIDFQMDIDEKQFVKSSLVGGALGAAAFGVSGAVIGSRPRGKVVRDIKGYAIITYETAQSEDINIVFKDELANSLQCAKLVDELKPRINPRTSRVEL